MIQIDRLRLLILVNVNQPLAITAARDLFISAGGKTQDFAQALSLLRAEKYLSEADPVYCTAKGLSVLQSNKFFKYRDAGRMFFLKTQSKPSTLKRRRAVT